MSQSVNATPNGVGPNGQKPNNKKQQIVAATDTRAFSDALVRRLQLLRALVQSAPVTDVVARQLRLPRGLSQAVLITEQVSRQLKLNRSFADTELFGESYSIFQVRGITDTVLFSDSIARVVALGRSSTDTGAFAEGLSTPPKSNVRLAIDGESFSDSASFNLYPAPRAAEDDFTFTEDPDPLVVVARLVADSFPTTETMTSFAQAIRGLLDEFIIDELPVKISAQTQQLLDSSTFSESLVSSVIVSSPNSTTVQFADAVGTPTDPATVAVDLLRLNEEQSSYSELITANVTLVAKNISDTFSFTDSVVGFINNLPHGVVGKGLVDFISSGGSVKILSSGGSIILKRGSGTAKKTGGSGGSTPTSGSGEVN